jgi:hypothetical protein
MPLPGSWISAKYLFINKFKALSILLNGAKHKQGKEYFLFMPKNLVWTKQQRWTQCNHHKQSCVVRSS